ncbi:glycoprotein-N-acetylgalactosamine 3-beta-galactosyltransferase 1-like isoform X2 [Branchiostoma floridae x Branchiostoma japonicum]
MALEYGSTKRAMMTFTVGALFGGVVAMLVVSSEVLMDGVNKPLPNDGLRRQSYIRALQETVGDLTLQAGRDQGQGYFDTIEFQALNKGKEKSRVRVLCWVLTDPENHDSKALPAYDTWASKCDRTLFITTKSHSFLPTVVLNVTEGRESLLQKSIHAFKHVYEHHLDEADWFLKADDDTYVIMENLRHFLSNKDPEEPVYYGFRFNSIRPDTKNGYMSGGAGYVLSREAVRRLVTQGMDDPRKCRLHSKAPEDLEIGRCLEKAGVLAGDSRDEEGRQTFHCLSLQDHVLGNLPEWLHRYSTYPVKSGPDCCSKHTISFHYTEPIMMYVLDFAIHHIRPYGQCDRKD